MEEKSNQLVIIEQEKQILDAQKEKLSILRNGGMLPKGCDEREAFARVAVGIEMGMRPMQALNGIAMINGKPSLHTDSIPSIVAASGLLEDQGHEFTGEGDKLSCRYWCKKKGLPTVQHWDYSVADAKTAGLLSRDTWKNHLRKMLFNRARTYCLRNTFPEVLGNMYDSDEASEFTPENTTDAPNLAMPAEEPKKRGRKPKEEITQTTNEIKDLQAENSIEEITPQDAEFEEVKEPETVEEKAAALDDDIPALVQPRETNPEQQAPFALFEE